MDTLMQISSAVFLLIGSFLVLSGGVGILRFPNFHTRMHAVGVTDTLATSMILIGLILQSPDLLVNVKLMIILLMTLFISPAASHTLANASLHEHLAKQKNKKSNTEVTPSNP